MMPTSLLRSAVAAAALALTLAACGSDTSPKAAAPTTTTEAAGPPTSAGSAGVATDKVEVKDFSFKPKAVVVRSGTTVTWTFSDSAAHSIEPVGGSEPKKSPDLKAGGTYTFTFANAGTFSYRCGIHNSMTGTIVVTA